MITGDPHRGAGSKPRSGYAPFRTQTNRLEWEWMS
jgi:hypothetical protein